MINQENFSTFIEELKNFDYTTFMSSFLFWIPLTVMIIFFVICLFMSFAINRKSQHDNPVISPYRYGYFISLFFGILTLTGPLGMLTYLLISGEITEKKKKDYSFNSITTLIISAIFFLIHITKWILIFYRRHTGWIMLIVLQMLYLNIPCALINFIYYSSRSKNMNGSELK